MNNQTLRDRFRLISTPKSAANYRPENKRMSPYFKRKIIFQTQQFSGDMVVFGGVRKKDGTTQWKPYGSL